MRNNRCINYNIAIIIYIHIHIKWSKSHPWKIRIESSCKQNNLRCMHVTWPWERVNGHCMSDRLSVLCSTLIVVAISILHNSCWNVNYACMMNMYRHRWSPQTSWSSCPPQETRIWKPYSKCRVSLFYTFGGLGREVTIFYSRLANLLALHHNIQ